ncbi:unnamed protein product [Eruca vesicaria subsp. sativa]|uniref:RING-type E3 ubiquitin transferase n=1 Tax=Eruca vesicaria subsp. sativa TaxID=29727 RepID=A0ABC8L483_ERUVS|nr:unnamed protein product [Eruca vesicaria subsp. sativa]
MSLPPRNPDHRSPKRQRFPPPVPEEDEEEEEDDDYSAASIGDEEDEDSEDDTDESSDEEEEEEDVQVPEDVGDNIGDTQSRRSVSSSSPGSSSSQQLIKLKSSEILDCPTCCEPLKRPIYQCSNGHLACSLCCLKLRKKCPFCRLPIGEIRCRAMEKVIESSMVPCRNSTYGCQHTSPYGDQSTHERRCMYVACFCPLPHCNYTGAYMDVQTHARATHSWDAENLIPFVFDTPQIFSMNLAKKKTTIFQEEKGGDLVVVQAFKGTHGGVCVTVSCITPMYGSPNLSCSLAKLNAYTTLRLGVRVKKIQKVVEPEEPKDDFMFVPDYMLSGDHLKMQICVGSEYKYVHI